MKGILREIIKWLIITVIVGSIIWTTSSLYKFIKNKVGGS